MTYLEFQLPEPLREAAGAPCMARLRHIGMNCGCEYTSLPLFEKGRMYSRYLHSVGVAGIAWDHTGDLRQAMAGLLHDVATPCFAHAVDFFNGDYMHQESTEAGTREIIAQDRELQAILGKYGMETEDVADYHRYPVADNDPPGLCADRLEYTLGNLFFYGLMGPEEIRELYADVLTVPGEKPEVGFGHLRSARAFAFGALRCSKVYVSAQDRYAMQVLSEILRYAVLEHVICREDLYTTEEQVIASLMGHPLTREMWEAYRDLSEVTEHKEYTQGARQVSAKRRCIDPLVLGRGRLSEIDGDFRAELGAFLRSPQDGWLSGQTKSGNMSRFMLREF